MTIVIFKHYYFREDMTKLNIQKLRKMFSILSNEKRLKMIELCENQPLTITELSRKLDLNYSITVKYTSMLEKVDLIEKLKQNDGTVKINPLININNKGEIRFKK